MGAGNAEGSSHIKDPRKFYESGSTTAWAFQADTRFSYCCYVPTAHANGERLPVVVVQHGTARTNELYRDALATFAEKHGCLIAAPLFPAAISAPDDLHGFKFIRDGDLRYDHILLGIVDELHSRFNVQTDRFYLHGFSGGGQFAHRFLYLHPTRLAGVSIGAPGRITLLDSTKPWWVGTADVEAHFGHSIDISAMRNVPVQLVVGAGDTETWEINNHGDSNWMDGADATGRTRVERISALRDNLVANGVDAQLDIVPDVAHRGTGVLPAVTKFLGGLISAA